MIDTRIDSIIYQSEIYYRDLVNSLVGTKKVGKSPNSKWAKAVLILSYLDALNYNSRLEDEDDITNVNYILYQLIKLCELYQYPSAAPLVFTTPPDIIVAGSSTLLSGKILIGNSSNVATAVTPSGAVMVSNTGVFTMTAGAVTNGLYIAGGKIRLGGTLIEDTALTGAFVFSVYTTAITLGATAGLNLSGNGGSSSIILDASGILQSATSFVGTQKFQHGSLWVESNGSTGVFYKLQAANITAHRTLSLPLLSANAEVLTSEAVSNGLTVAANSLKLGGLLTASTSITGTGTEDLNLGTTGARLGAINLYGEGGINIVSANQNLNVTVADVKLNLDSVGQVQLKKGAGFKYLIVLSNLAADRTTTLPLLAANDTFAFQAHTQSLTNKTLGTGTKIALGSDATGDIYYNGGSTVLTRLAHIGSAGKMLRTSSASAFAWSTATYPDTVTAGDILVATSTNVLGTLAIGTPNQALVVNLAGTGLEYKGVGITLTGSAVINFGSVAVGSYEDSSGITIAGAAVGDCVIVTPSNPVSAAVVFWGYVSAADTVVVRFISTTAGTNPASDTYNIRVLK